MNIGHVAAEDDSFLLDCFVQHPAVEKCASVESPEMIVTGRTGSGKTAIARFISDTEDSVVEINPLDMSLDYISNSDALRFVQSIGGNLDVLFQILWKHVICIEFIRLRHKVTNEQKSKHIVSRLIERFSRDARKQKSLNYVREWEGRFFITMDQNIKEITEKYERGLRAEIGADLKKASARGQYVKQLSTEKKQDLVARTRKIIDTSQLAELNQVVEMLAEQSPGETMARHYIVIDRLDERWVDESIRFKLIRSLIESLKTFRRISNLKLLVAMRSDVLERVVQETRDLGFQREKFESYFVKIMWEKKYLNELVERRIQLLFKRQYSPQAAVKFEDIFCSKVGNRDPFDYIIERTLFRPRDVIAFVNLCLVKAEGKVNVAARCIQEVEREYSRTRREALEYEWQSTFPTLSKLLTFLSRRRSVCSARELLDKKNLEDIALEVATGLYHGGFLADPVLLSAKKMCESREGHEESVSHEEFLKTMIYVLYRVGAVGVKLGARERYLYSHMDQPIIETVEMGEEMKIHIHPMLHRALGIDERN